MALHECRTLHCRLRQRRDAISNQLTVYTGFALCLAAPYIDKHIGEEPEESKNPEESEKQEPHLIKEPNE
ncbi:hypothetical protein BFINE_40170 [Bacteroides finegoldii DSM 17565]|nr:hypothetical protein BFINE_40170 [Bacteroides finegoldii DSM 17565]